MKMNSTKALLILSVALLALTVAACSDDDDSTAKVTVSGTVTFASWTTGEFIVVAFPVATAAGPTGDIGTAFATGSTSAAAYSMDIKENSGDSYMFAWNDSDGSTDPDISTEDFGCVLFTVADVDLTGVDITLDSSGTDCTF